MKSILSVILLATLSISNAQNVSDYKYVIVPQEFPDFKKNDFNLTSRLKTYLRRKKYEIHTENSNVNLPIELQNNPCLATRVELQNVKSMFKNKLKVVFKNCNHSIVGEYEGVSSIKDFEQGYQEALQIAMNSVKTQSAKVIFLPPNEKKSDIVPKTTDTTEQSTDQYYTMDGKKYEVVIISTGNFIIIDKDTSKIIAQFFPSTQKNVYHVSVISPNGNYETIGYTNGNKIEIEYKTSTNKWELKTFSK